MDAMKILNEAVEILQVEPEMQATLQDRVSRMAKEIDLN